MMIKLASRSSPLAIAQSQVVADQLIAQGHQVDIIPMQTKGDRHQDVALSTIGGKGLFTDTLKNALKTKKVDAAVHSLKDVPSQSSDDDLIMHVIGPRQDPRDCLIGVDQWEKLRKGAIVGTASPRRIALLLAHRPDIKPKLLRGNINTRLSQLYQGKYDAIVLAKAGINRLGINIPAHIDIDPSIMLPAPGQGFLAIEYQRCNQHLNQLMSSLYEDTYSTWCSEAERCIVRELKANCHDALGALATCQDDILTLTALLASHCGSKLCYWQEKGNPQDYESIAKKVTEQLIKQGGLTLLRRTL